jgi:hypothetical protein
MEVVFLLEREEKQEEEFKAIHFKSVYGMPIKGEYWECLPAHCRVVSI